MRRLTAGFRFIVLVGPVVSLKGRFPLPGEIREACRREQDAQVVAYHPGDVVAMMRSEGFVWFSMYHHTKLWQRLDAKAEGSDYGAILSDGRWYWNDKWVCVVREYCLAARDRYEG